MARLVSELGALSLPAVGTDLFRIDRSGVPYKVTAADLLSYFGGGSGTVTSVDLASTTGLTASGGPITGSGSLTYTLSANLQAWHALATSAKQDALGYTPANKAGDTFTGVTRITGQSFAFIRGGTDARISFEDSAGVRRGMVLVTPSAGTSSLIAYDTDGGTELGRINVGTGGLTYSGNAVWHAGNDGASSGLDSDLLDGVQGSGYVNTTAAQTVAGVKTFTSNPRVQKVIPVVQLYSEGAVNGYSIEANVSDGVYGSFRLKNIAGTVLAEVDNASSLSTFYTNLRLNSTGQVQFASANYYIRASTGLEVSSSDFTRLLVGGVEKARVASSLLSVDSITQVAGTVQVRSSSFGAPSGQGVEIFYATNIGYLIGYDRDGAVWKEMRIYGNPVQFYANGTLVGQATTTGMEDAVGNLRDIPQNVQNANYTFVLADRGKHVIKTNTTAYAWTIPPNSSVAYPVGTAITVIHDSTAGNITLTRGSGVALLSGTTDANVTLTAGQARTLLKVGTDRWRLL